MSNMVSGIDVRNPNAGLIKTVPIVSAISGAVGGISGPAAPIVIPLAAVFVLAKWVFEVYQNSFRTLERFMAYIVNLTLMMEHIFFLTQETNSTVSRRLIKLAYRTYQSSLQSTVHVKITQYVNDLTLIRPGAKDTTIDKIVELIGPSPKNFTGLKERLGSLDLSGQDEPWDDPESSP